MDLYTYEHTCPDCGEDWIEHRLEPFEIVREEKLCSECKSSGDSSNGDGDGVKVKDNGGLSQNKKCGNCVHFQPLDEDSEDKLGKPWGTCGLGHKNPDVREYTLTYAIDNLEDCPIGIEDYPDYGNERLDLVHYFDSCDDFEEEQND